MGIQNFKVNIGHLFLLTFSICLPHTFTGFIPGLEEFTCLNKTDETRIDPWNILPMDTPTKYESVCARPCTKEWYKIDKLTWSKHQYEDGTFVY